MPSPSPNARASRWIARGVMRTPKVQRFALEYQFPEALSKPAAKVLIAARIEADLRERLELPGATRGARLVEKPAVELRSLVLREVPEEPSAGEA